MVQLLLSFCGVSPREYWDWSNSNYLETLINLLSFLGVIAAKQKKEVVVSFRTDEAKVIIATLVVKVFEGTSELTKVIKLSAIGKYPFMTLD